MYYLNPNVEYSQLRAFVIDNCTYLADDLIHFPVTNEKSMNGCDLDPFINNIIDFMEGFLADARVGEFFASQREVDLGSQIVADLLTLCGENQYATVRECFDHRLWPNIRQNCKWIIEEANHNDDIAKIDCPEGRPLE